MVRPDQQLPWHKAMWDKKIVFGVIDPPYVFSEELLQWNPKQLKTKKKREEKLHAHQKGLQALKASDELNS